MKRIIAVLDIGKTNIKLCALHSLSGDTVAVVKRSNSVLKSRPYPHVDVEGIWDWYKAELKKFSERFSIEYLCCTTHGATVVCLSGDRLAFPVFDYESDLCEQSNQGYASVRPPYNETLSPTLSVGLNAGRQLYWLSEIYPEKFQHVDTILMYPQYWAWRLTGIAVSEVTSLGCHTDLWQPLDGVYSSLVNRMGWTELFPALLAAGEALGPILEPLANELGLSEDCRVINGIHDSNASLVPYLRNETQPFTVISSGTWTVIANVGSSIDNLLEEADMLCNVNAYGDPVPCIRFMGGREWEILRGDKEGKIKDLVDILKADVFLLPSFADQGGPFRHRNGEVIGPIDSFSGSQQTTLASLYCALVTDFCLSRINSSNKIIVEGSFAKNDIYLTVLQILRSEQEVSVSNDTTGTTVGAAQLVEGCNWPQKKLSSNDDSQMIDAKDALTYRERWTHLLSIPPV